MEQALAFTAVAFLWGATNPWLKRGSERMAAASSSGADTDADTADTTSSTSTTDEERRRQRRWRTGKRRYVGWVWDRLDYIVPLLLNLSGSLLYYLTLRDADLSLAVPVTNSLTFLFTTVVGAMLGENIGGAKTVGGIALVLAGVYLCVTSHDAAASLLL